MDKYTYTKLNLRTHIMYRYMNVVKCRLLLLLLRKK